MAASKKATRLTKYEEWERDGVLEEKLSLIKGWRMNGVTQQKIAENVGLNEDTLCRYKNRYPKLKEALDKGKEQADLEVEDALFKNATGFWYDDTVVSTKKEVIYDNGKRVKEISEPIEIKIKRYKPSETAAAIFWLKNRRYTEWRDKINYEMDNKDINLQIANIANLLNNPAPNRTDKDV